MALASCFRFNYGLRLPAFVEALWKQEADHHGAVGRNTKRIVSGSYQAKTSLYRSSKKTKKEVGRIALSATPNRKVVGSIPTPATKNPLLRGGVRFATDMDSGGMVKLANRSLPAMLCLGVVSFMV